MAMYFIPRHHTFTVPGTEQSTYDFGNKVRTCGGAIQAYAVRFPKGDHMLKDIEVSVKNVVASGTRVSYDITFSLRDNSGNKGLAEIDVVLMADVESM